jgi:hypothetical protein
MIGSTWHADVKAGKDATSLWDVWPDLEYLAGKFVATNSWQGLG